jgi:hypothetical protein
MNKSPIAKFMGRHEFLSRQAAQKEQPAASARIAQMTPDEIRAENKRLEDDNARMRALQAHRIEAESAQMLADREKRARESAEQLMRQMGLKHV